MLRSVVFFSVFTISLCHSSLAQFGKGTWMIGTNVGGAFFNSGKYDYSYNSSVSGYTSHTDALGMDLTPNMGWFIAKSTVVGVRVAIGYQYDKKLDAVNNVTFARDVFKTNSTGFQGYLRHYFLSGVRYLPFAQAGAGIGMASSRSEGFKYTSTHKDMYRGKSSKKDAITQAGFLLGVTRMLGSSAGVELFTGYNYQYHKSLFLTNTTRDIGIDGSIDETGSLEQTRKASTHNWVVGVGVQIFLKKGN